MDIELLGRRHGFRPPPPHVAEEIVTAWGEVRRRRGVAVLRAYGAAIGLCTRLGQESGADYAGCRFDPLEYGGEVYAWLIAQGATIEQIGAAGAALVSAAAEVRWPRKAAVDAAEKNSGAGEAS